jgi:hypothetical protein
MGLFDDKVAGSGKGLPTDATFTWNCEKKGFFFSPSKDVWVEAKNIVAIVIRSDMYRIGGKQGNCEFKSEYGASGFVRGARARTKLYDGKTVVKDFGPVDWFKVHKERDFAGSQYKNFTLVKMLSYEIEDKGSFRKNTPDDPTIVLLHSKYTGHKNIEKVTEELKLKLIAEGKGDLAEKISPYELGGVGIKYMGKTNTYKSETYGKENTYPVPELVWLKDSKPEIFKEAMNQWHRFNDELLKYWAGDFDDYVPAEAGETPPPPPPTETHQSEIDDLPF